MLLSDFYFDLPEELIAQKPSEKRGDDKLLLLGRNSGETQHFAMSDLPSLVEKGTLMIFNNSRVRRSRCFAKREGGERVQEFLFLTALDSSLKKWSVMARGAKKVKPNSRWIFSDGSAAEVLQNSQDEKSEFRTLLFDFALDDDWFLKNGHIPLPPYIKREDSEMDGERYQNVYAKETGSSACPTAGLHFTEEMLSRLDSCGIERAFVTLHVGLGTFLPVREEKIEDHKMHEEYYTIPEETAQKINAAKKEGRKILAVGTTSVRTLESAADENGFVKSGSGSTRIFMYPGYKFRVIDALFTNFHTPESTLIMLVSAFAGRENILRAYNEAIQRKYRFFSYGDAMLIK